MLIIRTGQRRRGTILPMLAICLVALCGFVALGIDVGLIAAAKTDCQNAADAAALTGTRNIDGSANGNVTVAMSKAQAIAMANQVLGQSVQAADVTLQAGTYHYDPNSQTFTPQFPPVPPDNYNLMQATVQHTVNYTFGRVFNLTSINVSATAIATHRPRDTSIVLDYSGSMNNESDLWNCESYLGTMINTSNNTDPVFPQWGQYDPTWSPLAALQCTSSDPRVGYCNVTQSVLGVAPLVQSFYQNARGAGAQSAFSPAPSTVTNTSPGGESAQSHVKNLIDLQSNKPTAFTGASGSGLGFKGYKTAYGQTQFYGYRQGPGYWGKTFFIWPPDPTTDSTVNPNTYTGFTQFNYTCDWRKRFFLKPGGSYPLFGGPVNDNTLLWASGSGSSGGGQWNDPPGNYVINYAAILQWIKTASSSNGPDPFPPILRAGNLLYYDSIPNDVPSSAYDHTQPNRNISDPNQRFWKEYIDYVLGVWRDPFGSIQHPANPSCSYGNDYTCGSATSGTGVSISGPDSTSTPDSNGKAFINPNDNPKRPRHRFWFGPMTMVQYLSDTGLFPGTVTDISMLPAKLGIDGALTDIQNNHPNDLVSMLLYNRPHFSGEPTEVGAFSQPQFSLSRDYTGMINALWYPPNSSSTDVRPWDANGAQTPRAHGDYTSNTATSYGFMLAYNQFSSNSSLRSQSVGGLGRKGSQRLVVLETDGMANVHTAANFTSGGPYNSYYNITPNDSVTGSSTDFTTAANESIAVIQKICALTTDNANGPGFATPTKPVIVHCIAFGAIFEPTAQDGQSANAMSMLQQISSIGKTGFPPSVTATSDPNYYKLCIGTLSDRQAKLRKAFSLIMDDGISVVMVK
ncbi:MAG TPA: TadE/TadG family type IV pilus assembly protein [Gemmataceae bacterium]|nr:TadE/TadG family type IV pilus assembly protein [Gemmataceae bacterium]